MAVSARAVVVITAFAVFSLAGCGLQQGVVDGSQPGSALQSRAPAITAVLVDGGHVDWAALSGHPIVLDFWASWCGPCRAEQAELNSLHQHYAAAGVTFLGVDVRDDTAQALAFRHDLNVVYPSAADPDEQISAAYDIAAPPTIVVIDSRGRIVDRLLGTVVGLSADLQTLH
jgi:thiol-disulfide isomerase/thioredoxin